VSPLEFIPIAEKTKLILPIGEKVIVKAFHFLNKLRDLGYDKTVVSINISVIQLLSPDFTGRLFELITEMQVNPYNVCIEITESVFATDFDNINRLLGKLQGAGLNIIIDDFGTGYSSLSREGRLKVDCMKIDKYFIDNLMQIDLNKAITGDIISMAHKMGHWTIAEGVEHYIQLKYLEEHNCDRVQGYLISKPLDVSYYNSYGRIVVLIFLKLLTIDILAHQSTHKPLEKMRLYKLAVRLRRRIFFLIGGIFVYGKIKL
jgi:EAL domain-containing protein (putative c-di-GMP-specific phosphodiesterase class I)